MTKRRLCWSLFASFFRIGLFTFGGGYAMLPLIESVCVEKQGWITHEELLQITVLAEATPGPVAINCATFVGNRRAGLAGALAATLGVVLPSFGVILAVALFLRPLFAVPLVVNAFRGIRIAVSLLILRAGLRMLKLLNRRLPALLLAGAACGALLVINLLELRFSTIWLLLIGAALSFFACLERELRGRREEKRK